LTGNIFYLFALQLVDQSLVELDQKTLKVGIYSFPAQRSAFKKG